MQQRSFRLSRLVTLIVLFAALLFVWLKRNAVYDWFRLYNYAPPTSVVQLATDTTMTAKASHLFYINHPMIQGKTDFNQNCPNNGGEQTIILGCYHANETGIFLYNVTDAQLAGVEQVTAAHETLHAAYERLSPKERTYVDGLLEDYYQHDLHDQRLLDTIAAYKKTEPNDVVNEMHSVFGTEVMNLPPALETYYRQYFTNRQQIAAYAQKYESAFTGRKAQVDQDDAQLATLKKQLDAVESSLGQQEVTLSSQLDHLNQLLADKDYNDYNTARLSYNDLVRQYNNDVDSEKTLVSQYNALVNARNAIALQEQQLFQALNSNTPAESLQ